MKTRGFYFQTYSLALLPLDFRVKAIKLRKRLMLSLVAATVVRVTLIHYLVKKDREGWL